MGVPLPKLCYDLAYFLLPQALADDPARALGWFQHGGPYLYALVCAMTKIEPDPAVAATFSVAVGKLGEGRSYCVLAYPSPPPLDPRMLEPGWAATRGAVLAPHFSAIVLSPAGLAYFVLGQRPGGGTTLRSVRPGMNANLGEGPAPTLAGLLEVLAARVTG